MVLLVGAAVPGSAPTPTVFEEPAVVQSYQEQILPERLAPLLEHFSSDAFAGRETGTVEALEAATFLADAYRELGLKPPPGATGDGAEAYLQEFVLFGPELYEATLTAKNARGSDLLWSFDPHAPGSDIYLAGGTLPTIAGPVEFRGLDRSAAAMDYDDYAILHPGHAPRGASWIMAFAPNDLLQPFESEGAFRSTSTWPRLNLNVPTSDDGPLPIGFILVASEERVARESRLVAEVALSVGRLSLEPGSAPYGYPPVYVISEDVAEALLDGSGISLDDLRESERTDGASARLPLDGVRVTSHVDFPIRPYTTANVAAYVEGIDPLLRDEFVVISGHYDHVGVNPLLKGDTIYNGADDNGSGNVAMLEIARILQRAKAEGRGPRRSVAFVHFTAEEKGLLGSRYYADTEPLFPIDFTVANLNLDMIGRTDLNPADPSLASVYVIGSKLVSPELHEVIERVNDVTGVDLVLDERYNSVNDPNQYYRRSDQWNFGRYGIPFVFFFTGAHEDYHRPSDEADRVDYERLARVSRLIFGTTWQLANQDHRLKAD
ncbi:MAG TPA: M28 family peptidase [Rhodothermales bacterium]